MKTYLLILSACLALTPLSSYSKPKECKHHSNTTCEHHQTKECKHHSGDQCTHQCEHDKVSPIEKLNLDDERKALAQKIVFDAQLEKKQIRAETKEKMQAVYKKKQEKLSEILSKEEMKELDRLKDQKRGKHKHHKPKACKHSK